MTKCLIFFEDNLMQWCWGLYFQTFQDSGHPGSCSWGDLLQSQCNDEVEIEVGRPKSRCQLHHRIDFLNTTTLISLKVGDILMVIMVILVNFFPLNTNIIWSENITWWSFRCLDEISVRILYVRHCLLECFSGNPLIHRTVGYHCHYICMYSHYTMQLSIEIGEVKKL